MGCKNKLVLNIPYFSPPPLCQVLCIKAQKLLLGRFDNLNMLVSIEIILNVWMAAAVSSTSPTKTV